MQTVSVRVERSLQGVGGGGKWRMRTGAGVVSTFTCPSLNLAGFLFKLFFFRMFFYNWLSIFILYKKSI